ncbi:hypothetical protein [Kineococcus esterisolvens]|uniref:hypothetical protein n=1 Tax=Kineococcus sp. SYSU DK017 TaxID=3383138 RepID=UPI003D7C9804
MEHGRQDEDPLARALRALGTSDPGVDVVALTAGARGRARTVRLRRRTTALAVAAVALVVPAGLSRLPGTEPPPRTAVASPEAVAELPAAALLDDAPVREVLPDAVADAAPSRADAVGAAVTAGLCGDESFASPGAVVAARSAGWSVQDTVVQPLRQSVTERVLLLRDGGAREFVAQVREQAAGCATAPEGSTSWQVREDSGLGDDSVTGWAQVLPGDNPHWRVLVVAREGDVVVVLRAEVFRADGAALAQQVQELAQVALRRAAAEVSP